jgi:hypothetical protein
MGARLDYGETFLPYQKELDHARSSCFPGDVSG